MEVKIKNNNEMIDATIEMVDGVMVVSPVEEERWKPKLTDIVHIPMFLSFEPDGTGFYFSPLQQHYEPEFDMFLNKGMCFKTKAECQAFCDKLNEAINQVKP